MRPLGTTLRVRWATLGRRERALAVAVGAAVVLAVLVLVIAGGTPRGGEERTFGAQLADPIPYDGRSPRLPGGPDERVLVELPRPALGALDGGPDLSAAEQTAYVASLRAEADALLSALRARGIRLRDVVSFERTWHGFAATVRARDLPRLQSAGVRLRTNRRLYPAFAEPVPVGPQRPPAPVRDGPRVTLLAGGVAGAAGYDAVDGDDDPAPAPDPRDPGGTELGGAPLSDVLAALGASVRVVRVAGTSGAQEAAQTDQLLAGLEHTVDPNRDGAVADADPVALIGVSSPYAGFADAPEAEAVDAARALGTTVVAPAGQEGPAAGPFGTIGSPGAAAGALTVAPASDPRAVARTRLGVGNTTVTGAALLGGGLPTGTLRTAGPVDATDPAALLARDAAPLQGRLAVVRAGANPAAQVAAAGEAGAAAVLLADPRDGHLLPAVSAGRVGVPVLGVAGAAARQILSLPGGLRALAAGVQPPPAAAGRTASRYASAGPTYDGRVKPGLTRPGALVTGGRLVAGAAVAAARVAVEAARGRAPEPRTGSVRARPTPVPVGGVRVTGTEAATGVAFTVGRFDRGDPAGGRGATIVPAERLDLTLERSTGRGSVERLTPPGGARGVLPGEYAYTLPRATYRGLAAGSYAFTVRARAPGQRRPSLATSPVFTKP